VIRKTREAWFAWRLAENVIPPGEKDLVKAMEKRMAPGGVKCPPGSLEPGFA